METFLKRLAVGLAVAAMYVVTAKLGFRAAFVAEQVTTVWAPTGIAQAALLLWGLSLWPAVWIGAFVANAMTHVPIGVAAGIATGNTLEAVVAAWTLTRIAGFDSALTRARDAVAFICIAVATSTMISATVGAAMLCAGGVQPWSRYWELWPDWWLGDALGSLVVAPVLLTVIRSGAHLTRERFWETAGWVAAAMATTDIVFGGGLIPYAGRLPFAFTIFPFVIIAAVRLGQPATALVIAGTAAMTIWNTTHGYGPFTDSPIHQRLILVQVFMGVLSGSGLLLAAAITERHDSERQRSENERRTHAILETALDAIISMDHHGVITEFNAAAERMFGHQRQTAIGREMAEMIKGPFIGGRVETTARRADGSEFPVEMSIASVPTDPPIFTGFVRDTTDRMNAERERRQLLDEALDARQEAEGANRAKDEFLATLSHELRTPLNAIVGWTRMLLDGTLDQGTSHRALEIIDRNAQTQMRLVADILEVSRIITGKLRLDIRPVDLGSIIGSVLDGVRPAADAKQIHIRSRLTPSARLTAGDPQRLQQIVWNLVSNAMKFTPQDGSIDLELADSGPTVCIRVTDSGVGIAPEFLRHVFERFRQADSSSTRQHGGLGLGLAIVRHLVELHGGTVRAESDGAGKGATFIVELPKVVDDEGVLRKSPGQIETADRARAGAPRLTGCRILIVEDDEDARELLAALLSQSGAAIESANSVDQALSALRRNWPDVLISDIGFARQDGYALIREVRGLETQGRTPLPAMAVTAYARQEDHDRAIAAGFNRFLAKPIRTKAIIETVHELWTTRS